MGRDGVDLSDYRYRGAGALVSLHETHLRSFLAVWREARSRRLALPETEDPDCASLDAMLRHVLRAARGYMTWCCEVLDLADPEIPSAPTAEHVADSHEAYAEILLDRWRESPLREVEEKRFYDPPHLSRWKVPYCVDAMLEHAVMHPIRHERQLNSLLGT